jgi:hypothetical protein
VLYDSLKSVIVDYTYEDNRGLVDRWAETMRPDCCNLDRVVIEEMSCYGQALTAPLRDTIRWTGRIEQVVQALNCIIYVDRPTVLTWLCGRRSKVSKAQSKAALCGRLWNTDLRGAKGTKANPGPAYGFTGDHLWDALACAVWFTETRDDG